jgi:two-component system, OmpR family, sensor histidine kinase MprB
VSLRLKLVLALVALSALATAAIGFFSYRTTQQQLLGEIDSSLTESAAQFGQRGAGGFPGGQPDPDRDRYRNEGDSVIQVLYSDGTAYGHVGEALPIDDQDRTVAASALRTVAFRDAEVDDEPFRILTAGLGDARGAVQVARSLAETERVLAALRTRILVASLVVVTVAAFLGALIARQVTRRLVRLTGAAEQVTATGSLDVEVPISGTDETGRLGTAFNEMLAALGRSKEDQKRLVQDAGHELRTPLTSLRTNVYTLRRADELGPEQRARVLDDLQGETEELTRLINEVVELATDRRGDEPEVQVRLKPLVERVAARSAQRSGRSVLVHSDDAVVLGRPLALERAVGNLVENALKFDETGGPVDLTCTAGRIEVSDRGPGFDEADLPHVFDRFFRATSARSRPGSGLGLSIVHDVVEAHGGTVYAGNRPGGGAVVGFQLPGA